MPTGDPWCAVHGFSPCRCHEFRGMNVNGDFTVFSSYQEERLRKLEVFYATIRKLATTANLSKIVPVYEALSEVDSNWNEGNYNPQPDWGAGHGGEG